MTTHQGRQQPAPGCNKTQLLIPAQLQGSLHANASSQPGTAQSKVQYECSSAPPAAYAWPQQDPALAPCSAAGPPADNKAPASLGQCDLMPSLNSGTKAHQRRHQQPAPGCNKTQLLAPAQLQAPLQARYQVRIRRLEVISVPPATCTWWQPDPAPAFCSAAGSPADGLGQPACERCSQHLTLIADSLPASQLC